MEQKPQPNITNTMQRQAAAKTDRQIGGTEDEIPQANKLTRQNTNSAPIGSYQPKLRKSEMGCVTR